MRNEHNIGTPWFYGGGGGGVHFLIFPPLLFACSSLISLTFHSHNSCLLSHLQIFSHFGHVSFLSLFLSEFETLSVSGLCQISRIKFCTARRKA